VEAVVHQVALHAQVVGEAHGAATPHLLQGNMQHQRGTFAQHGCGFHGPGRRIGLERRNDLGHAVQAKYGIDLASGQFQVALSRLRLPCRRG
jgi:hypothetical protein